MHVYQERETLPELRPRVGHISQERAVLIHEAEFPEGHGTGPPAEDSVFPA